MTQEVGFVEPRRGKINFDKYPIGKLLLLFPFHVSKCIYYMFILGSSACHSTARYILRVYWYIVLHTSDCINSVDISVESEVVVIVLLSYSFLCLKEDIGKHAGDSMIPWCLLSYDEIKMYISRSYGFYNWVINYWGHYEQHNEMDLY